MPSLSPQDPDPSGPSGTAVRPGLYEDSFRVADQLAVHGSDCVCPPCAGRLTGLLHRLSAAVEREAPTE